MTTTPTSGAADLPEALRSIQRFEVVDCIDDKHVPAVIPKPHGPWVRYEDHIAALAAGQATAAQQVVAYAALPTSSHAGRVYEEGFLIGTCPLYTADKIHAFADAAHTLRASHGQAPAGATEPTEQQILEAAFAPAQPAAEPSRFGSPELQAMIIARCVEKDQADSVQEDAARYRWLRYYLPSNDTQHDDALVAARDAVERDTRALEYLQDYAKACYRSGVEAGEALR